MHYERLGGGTQTLILTPTFSDSNFIQKVCLLKQKTCVDYGTHLAISRHRRLLRLQRTLQGREYLVPQEEVVSAVHRPRRREPVGERAVYLHLKS